MSDNRTLQEAVDHGFAVLEDCKRAVRGQNPKPSTDKLDAFSEALNDLIKDR